MVPLKILPNSLLFPLAAAINFFSITALLIVAGVAGKSELAANIGIVQGAILVVFLSLSGNARNLILSSRTVQVEQNVFYFRLTLLLPAILVVVFLSAGVVETPGILIGGLIVRKCSEWFAELQLGSGEKRNDYVFAFRYIWTNCVALFLLLLALFFTESATFYFILYAWSIVPMIMIWPFFRWILGLDRSKVGFSELIPHLGSSTIIGVSTYIFRIFIVLLAGKSIAGLMFTAYALGGVVSALYTYALGPSLMVDTSGVRGSKVLAIFVAGCVVTGLMVLLIPMIVESGFSYNPLFLYGLGFSLIGGGVMLLAQQRRLIILQVLKEDVFVPDALVNILLISMIPFSFYLFGQSALTILFLLSAVLNLFFYTLLAKKGKPWNV